MIRIQTILIITIPRVLSIPFPQQNGQSDSISYGSINLTDSEGKNRILYWVFGIVGIAVFVEVVYWMRGLFDTPSYAGSIDEQLPPYEGFSLPKYNNIINENTSDEGTENTQTEEINTSIPDTNSTVEIEPLPSLPQSQQSQQSPQLPQPPQPARLSLSDPPSYKPN
ncbi:20196_t:CDS:2 [Rhizophagus irregularis]|nr:20196_t:CDS:2 [Rhizophagus irregularis]